MKIITNKFGSGKLYGEEDLLTYGTIYCRCCACMSVYADFLTWANNYKRKWEPKNIVLSPELANQLIVLSCQVTDIAVLNDIRNIEALHLLYPEKDIFVGGCLAYRFDIHLPEYVKRLVTLRSVGTEILDKKYVDFAKPFWIRELSNNKFDEGMLFRDMYPLQIGAGCNKNCEYCTIKNTRGESFEIDISQKNVHGQTPEDIFLKHENVVLIADSPTVKQIKDWCHISVKYGKPLSLRNVEPDVVMSCYYDIYAMAKMGLLPILHSPIQSMQSIVLKTMKRPVQPTLDFISKVPELQKLEVFVATNIIIDYDEIPSELEKCEKIFNYVSWNPYWDGKWNREKAEERYAKYINI